MRLTVRAVRDVTAIRVYIARENPAAAGEVSRRLHEAMASLDQLPERGRPLAANIRQLVVDGLPYTITYRVTAALVEIAAVTHQRRH